MVPSYSAQPLYHIAQSMQPVSVGEWLFVGLCVAASIAAFLFITRVYDKSLPVVYLTALLISWVPVQVLAWAGEGRHMWVPGEHSAVFFWGDSVLLPLTAVCLALLRREWKRQNPAAVALADRWSWRLCVLAVAVIVSVIYHSHEVMTWPPVQVHAPSKLWHDFFVYPMFIYFLGTQAPFLWQVKWRLAPSKLALATSGAVIGICGWWALGHVYDPSQVNEQRPLLYFAHEASFLGGKEEAGSLNM